MLFEYKCIYLIVNFFDLFFNALNRMLSVIFALMIDWYTNKGQTSCTVNEHNVVSL